MELSIVFILFLITVHGKSSLYEEISAFNDANIEVYPTKLSKADEGIYYLAMVADNDHKSKLSDNIFVSYIQHCKLTINNGTYSIEFIAAPFANSYDDMNNNKDNFNYIELQSKYGRKERGMELSELIVMNGHLLTMDDRTGILYEIDKYFTMIPRAEIKEYEDNKFKEKGLKIEWSTIKNGLLYIGSFGKEYTNIKGTIISKLSTNYIAIYNITSNELQYNDWSMIYNKMRLKTGTLFPGYLWHEAIEWSHIHKKWFVLPRYISFDFYDEDITELKGSNLLLICSEDFNEMEFVWIGNTHYVQKNENKIISILDDDKYKQFDAEHINLPYSTVFDLNDNELEEIKMIQNEMRKKLVYSNRGFSSITFLPQTNDTVIVALKTAENIFYECEMHENQDETCDAPTRRIEVKSYITIFDIKGHVILYDVDVPSENSYEGIVVL